MESECGSIICELWMFIYFGLGVFIGQTFAVLFMYIEEKRRDRDEE
jgi:hypothetical protein